MIELYMNTCYSSISLFVVVTGARRLLQRRRRSPFPLSFFWLQVSLLSSGSLAKRSRRMGGGFDWRSVSDMHLCFSLIFVQQRQDGWGWCLLFAAVEVSSDVVSSLDSGRWLRRRLSIADGVSFLSWSSVVSVMAETLVGELSLFSRDQLDPMAFPFCFWLFLGPVVSSYRQIPWFMLSGKFRDWVFPF